MCFIAGGIVVKTLSGQSLILKPENRASFDPNSKQSHPSITQNNQSSQHRCISQLRYSQSGCASQSRFSQSGHASQPRFPQSGRVSQPSFSQSGHVSQTSFIRISGGMKVSGNNRALRPYYPGFTNTRGSDVPIVMDNLLPFP